MNPKKNSQGVWEFGSSCFSSNPISPTPKLPVPSPQIRSARVIAFALLIVAVGCGGRQAKLGRGDATVDLATPYARAVEAEETKGASAAMTAYLDLLAIAR